MAGIYIHIPFCKQACHYCDFHFSTNLQSREKMVASLIKELGLRSDYLSGPIRSVYFGGGTPSLLMNEEIASLVAAINQLFEVTANAEITLEANPDDITKSKLSGWRTAGINRLSIGIQTFDQERLRLINRAHTAREATTSLSLAKEAGYDNISADLIYAIPPDDMGYWEKDLNQILEFNLPHLSIYGLTIEEKTVFGNWVKKGQLTEVDEEVTSSQYKLAMNILKDHGYDHYEVSNFAKPGYHSRHNSAYWDDQLYLGIGPGAHSYDGANRSFNVSNNAKYLSAIASGQLPLTIDPLSITVGANEYLLTHIRTSKGVDLSYLKEAFSKDLLRDFHPAIELFLQKNLMVYSGDRIALTPSGFLLADEISLRLFYDE